MDRRFICFGEMLWDILPDTKLPGGAPMNVAIHLKYKGCSVEIISKVGNDALGNELKCFLQEKEISTEYIQTSSGFNTGTVKANISERQEVVYEIISPAAWDSIALEENQLQLLGSNDVLIFGSLSSRNTESAQTLKALLKSAQIKVFDVNFRPPFYSKEIVENLLKETDILKLNHHELKEIVKWYKPFDGDKEGMEFLLASFALQMVILTRGENGASVLQKTAYVEHNGYVVDVEDTIGSGDAFLATFLAEYFNNVPVEDCLQNACKVGALVASKKGATPFVANEERENVISLRKSIPN